MKDIIAAKLTEIEQSEAVTIIHAVESGSRAWGFASPDSDYDVRFIYARPKEFYLRLDQTRDVIEWQLDDTLDINGWDLQKALRLLHSSNPTLFEWANSPIVYQTTPKWGELQKEINTYFSAKASLHHYLSTAKRNYRESLKGETVRLKKYFYVLRPLLACRWILQRKCPPPMLFAELADAVLQTELKPVVDHLLHQKMQTPELGEGKRIDELNDYIENNLVALKAAIDTLPSAHQADWGKLNALFLAVIE
ncbi:nucleotidyltransferase domain-containing protein [Eubacteriales bacterium OttesenSCG-928-N14]|nr:nucleotidyltransferase domain-containing protein [Eubacteriales bacterium OttesenSCG-928-N14]